MPQSINIFNSPLAITSYKQLADDLFQQIETHDESVLSIDFVNTHVVTMRQHDPLFLAVSNQSMNLFIPDGMPLIWYMNAKGAKLKDRVFGPTFMRHLLTNSPPQTRHFLIGGSERCAELLRARFSEINPGIEFCGGFHGPCSQDGYLGSAENHHAVLNEILEKQPHFIWVGLGAPKQYHLIARLKPHLRAGILLAVGFAFDVNAGLKSDAPIWMQRLGLTWAFRLYCEPKRLLSRYAKYNSLFIYYLLRDSLFNRKRLKKN